MADGRRPLQAAAAARSGDQQDDDLAFARLEVRMTPTTTSPGFKPKSLRGGR